MAIDTGTILTNVDILGFREYVLYVKLSIFIDLSNEAILVVRASLVEMSVDVMFDIKEL